jgi:hypothetical protein
MTTLETRLADYRQQIERLENAIPPLPEGSGLLAKNL